MRILSLLALVVLVGVMVSPAFAADSNYPTYTQTAADSFWIKKGEGHYLSHWYDSMTVHAKYGDTLINLGAPLYNARMRCYNPATDSGYIKVGISHGIWHVDSVSRNLRWQTKGQATGGAVPDTFWLYFGGVTLPKQLPVRPVVGGVADSTTLIFIEGWR